MSYEVIARKWRPLDFSQFVGQSHVSQTLINALQNDRLPHALLFTGPRGTGKTSTARILAKALRCPNAKNFTPCNKCSECEDIFAGRSIDVKEIDGASNNGVDAIRELRDTIGYMPSSGKYKLYIIDEVHMLSTSAFNALLKTLEEPPSHVVFIMATTEAHKIPNTILSRCQRYDFRRFPTKTIAEHLNNICKKEKVKTDEDALWVIARQGDGSMRDSQSLLDQVITFSDGRITMEKVVDALGLTDRQLLTSTLQALVDRNTQNMVGVVNKIMTSGFDANVYIKDLLEELRHLLLAKLCPDNTEQVVDLPEGEIEFLKKLGNQLSEEDVHLLFDMALKGANDIPRAQDPQIVLEMLLFRMASAPRIESLVATAASPRPQAPSRPVPSRPTPTTPEPPVKKNMEVANEAPVNGKSEQWLDLVNRIKKINQVVAAKLEHSFLIKVDNKNVIIGVPQKMKFLHDQIKDGDFQKKLTNYINTFWGPGHSVELSVEVEESMTAKKLEDKKEDDRQRDIREQVESHPMVQSVREAFESRIVAIKEEKESKRSQES